MCENKGGDTVFRCALFFGFLFLPHPIDKRTEMNGGFPPRWNLSLNAATELDISRNLTQTGKIYAKIWRPISAANPTDVSLIIPNREYLLLLSHVPGLHEHILYSPANSLVQLLHILEDISFRGHII